MDRKHHAHQLKASQFDISTLAHADYHGGCDGYSQITATYLQSCGYTSFTKDEVITCFNDIISAHEWVYTLWRNMASNTAGPQVDHILQKSLWLFPTLESTVTNEVVDFYDSSRNYAI
jgi:hypothetical protein